MKEAFEFYLPVRLIFGPGESGNSGKRSGKVREKGAHRYGKIQYKEVRPAEPGGKAAGERRGSGGYF